MEPNGTKPPSCKGTKSFDVAEEETSVRATLEEVTVVDMSLIGVGAGYTTKTKDVCKVHADYVTDMSDGSRSDGSAAVADRGYGVLR